METRVNEDGKCVELWGTGEFKIPVIMDKKSFEDGDMIAGVTRGMIRKIRVHTRTLQGVTVRGNKELYDAVMKDYNNEFKSEWRDKRCKVGNGKGTLIRCPEQIKDPKTGEMVTNSCKNCPYYNSLDKKDYHTATFSELSFENEEGNIVDFADSVAGTVEVGDRYSRILSDLVEHVNQYNPIYGKLIYLRAYGVSQTRAAEIIGKSQSSVNIYLKKLYPIVTEFLENLKY